MNDSKHIDYVIIYSTRKLFDGDWGNTYFYSMDKSDTENVFRYITIE